MVFTISPYIEEGKDALARAAGIVQDNTIAQAAVAGAIGVAAGVGGVAAVSAIRKRRKKKKYVKKKKSTRRRTRRTRKHRRHRRRRGRHTPRTAGKGKDTSHRRIRYTRKGQPYVILSSGKARFIKMSSAKLSHKRKGGRY